MSAQIDAAFNYNDLQGLESLKSGARKDDPEALRAVAQQFESMFMGLIMKSMRDATDVIKSDLESSYQTEFYRDMHDQQLTLSLAQNGGFGLADVLYEQLSKSKDPEPFNPYTIDIKSMEDSIRPQIIPPQPNRRTDDESTPSVMPSAPISDAGDGFSSPQAFIATLMPIAEKQADELGVDPKILLAQAALETGWGQRMITKSDGANSNNFFGIKADHRWDGESAMTKTTEFLGGKAMTVSAPFRAYASPEDSFADYVQFLKQSERYQPALANASNPSRYVQALQDAGYATDPEYANKILGIANSAWFENT